MTTRYVTLTKSEKDRKSFHLDLKAKDTKNRTVEGMASTTDKDRHGDIVEPNIFHDSLQHFMQNPQLFLEHQQSIGTVKSVEVKDDGIKVIAKIDKGYEEADKAWKKVQQESLRAMSIGFIPEDTEFDEDRDAWIIKKGELLEVSLVSIPANRRALFSMMKGFINGTDVIDSCQPSVFDLAFKAIKSELFRLEQIWGVAEQKHKLDLEILTKRMQSLIEADSKEELTKECLEASRKYLMASLD